MKEEPEHMENLVRFRLVGFSLPPPCLFERTVFCQRCHRDIMYNV
jgi:hypothetical protein